MLSILQEALCKWPFRQLFFITSTICQKPLWKVQFEHKQDYTIIDVMVQKHWHAGEWTSDSVLDNQEFFQVGWLSDLVSNKQMWTRKIGRYGSRKGRKNPHVVNQPIKQPRQKIVPSKSWLRPKYNNSERPVHALAVKVKKWISHSLTTWNQE